MAGWLAVTTIAGRWKNASSESPKIRPSAVREEESLDLQRRREEDVSNYYLLIHPFFMSDGCE
jgi:hypothetical protein